MAASSFRGGIPTIARERHPEQTGDRAGHGAEVADRLRTRSWVQMSTISLGEIHDVIALVDYERPDTVLLTHRSREARITLGRARPADHLPG
jgi:hypothetical protein